MPANTIIYKNYNAAALYPTLVGLCPAYVYKEKWYAPQALNIICLYMYVYDYELWGIMF